MSLSCGNEFDQVVDGLNQGVAETFTMHAVFVMDSEPGPVGSSGKDWLVTE